MIEPLVCVRRAGATTVNAFAGGAMGRPVGVAIDGRGAPLVAGDVGNVVWRAAAAAAPPAD